MNGKKYDNVISQPIVEAKATSKFVTIAVVITCAVVSIAALLYIGKETYDMFNKETTSQSISTQDNDHSINNNKINK